MNGEFYSIFFQRSYVNEWESEREREREREWEQVQGICDLKWVLEPATFLPLVCNLSSERPAKRKGQGVVDSCSLEQRKWKWKRKKIALMANPSPPKNIFPLNCAN